jgi:transposase
MGYQGQVIERVEHDAACGIVRISCRRDQRVRPIAAGIGRCGGVHRIKRRWVSDLPLMGQACQVEIEYAEVFVSPSVVRVEQLPFVEPKTRVTKRYARLIAGLCRHMPISVVARHTGLRWNTVKSIDKAYLAETIKPVAPQTLEGIRYLGVDEVARAKGQDYLTLVYDLSPGAHCGRILWIKEGRDSAVLSEFLDALTQECAAGIEAVAMDMGAAYIAATKASLPTAAIVFDRFHIMQMFSKVIRDCRRAEFKSAKTLGDLTGQEAIKGSLYLLLGNRDNLKSADQDRLDKLLAQNEPLNKLYTLKEQLQALWRQPASQADMTIRLLDWCGMAEAAKISGLAKFVKTLRAHRTGICAWAEHPISTARLEAGNVSIALLRRRARGFRDTDYLKLKIYQTNTPDTPSMLFSKLSRKISV